MVLDPTDVFHTGFVVADVEAAMEELGRVFDLTWAPIHRASMRLRGADGPFDADMTFTYSIQGPPHLELLAAVEGTPWRQGSAPTPVGLQAAHHVGVWSDDVVADSEALEAAGAPRIVTYDHSGDGARGFAYHRLPSGLLVEIVDRSRKPDFDRWFAGESFTTAEEK